MAISKVQFRPTRTALHSKMLTWDYIYKNPAVAHLLDVSTRIRSASNFGFLRWGADIMPTSKPDDETVRLLKALDRLKFVLSFLVA